MKKSTKHSFLSVFTPSMALVFLMVGSLSLLGCSGGGGDSDSSSNTVPIANDDTYTLDYDTIFTADLSVNDIESAEGGGVWSKLSETTHGSVNVESDGQFQYTPDLGYIGEDFFSYLLTDIDGDSDSALVSLSILPIASINDPLLSEQWYLENTGQVTITGIATSGADIQVMGDGAGVDRYAQGFTGNGVEIAIIDTGLEIAHIDLAPNVVLNGSYNFSYPDNDKEQFDPTATNIDGDHGTSVAGLAGARGGNSEGIWGVAPSAELKGFNFLVTQALDEELASLGYTPSADSFPGLTSPEVDIFNKSYGRNPVVAPVGTELAYYDSLTGVMEWGTQNLRSAKGALYLKAGGNEFGGGTVFTDSECQQAIDNDVTCYNVNMETEHASPYQMVIGAFSADDKRASYSNTGSALWLSAPGGQTLGVMTTDQSGCDKGYNQTKQDYDTNCDYVATFGGTSAAVPIVSGAAALLLEANPNLSWRDVKHLLATTARQLDIGLMAKKLSVNEIDVILEEGWVTNDAGYTYSNAYGFGALSVDAAITMALKWKADNETLPPLQTLVKGPLTLSAEILDNNEEGLIPPPIPVNDSLVAESVALTLTIEATSGTEIDISDYQIILESPRGTKSILLTPFNAYQADLNMTGLTLISHAFYGETITGDWNLIIRDLHTGNTGKLTQWSLNFYGHQL